MLVACDATADIADRVPDTSVRLLSIAQSGAVDDIGDIVIGKVFHRQSVIVHPDPNIGDELFEPVRFLHSISGGGNPIFDELPAIGEVVYIDIVFFGKSGYISFIVQISEPN